MDSNSTDTYNTYTPSTDHTLTTETGQLDTLTPEDKQVVVELFQTHPKLWKVFRTIIDFCDQVDEGIGSADYEQLLRKLIPVYEVRDVPDKIVISKFGIAVGFVEGMVKLYRHIMSETGTAFVYDISPSGTERDERQLCLLLLWSLFQTFTHNANDFRLRLAQTGLFEDIVESLKRMRHIAADALSRGDVCSSCLATLHNCCKHEEVRVKVTDMDIVQHVLPFLRNTDMDRDIRMLSFMLLAFIVREGDVELLRLDTDLLTSCLHYTRVALDTAKRAWSIEEIFVGLALAMRLQSNRRLFAAKDGTLQVMTQVLQSGTDVEKEAVMSTLQQLINDPENVRMFKRDGVLLETLSAVQDKDSQSVHIASQDILDKIESVDAEDFEERSELAEVLTDQMNTLAILGVGPVQFLLDTLTDLNTSGSRLTSLPADVTSRDQTLRALTAMLNDDSCRREILSRGGLDVLQSIFKEGNNNEKILSANLVLQLSACREYCLLLQAHRQLMETMESLKSQADKQLSDITASILDSVNRNTA